jgi:DNA repair protein SbcC/Rad50
MHITRVELQNIKSHADAVFDFQRGTTAITGANGSGKTTIIEAVAWALFDRLDYTKENFARRGSKQKGVARVTFESSLDERQYTIYRDTANGYYVYDPRLQAKIADKKEEVSRFLRQHLGVEPGTDLDALFRQAIGVPQGTFTAIFLESTADRKKSFDKLLKVEEYQKSAERMRESVNFLRLKLVEVEKRIARAEGELARFTLVEAEYLEQGKSAKELESGLEQAAGEAAARREAVKKLDETEKQISDLKVRRDRARAELDTAEVILKQRESEHNDSLLAARKIEAAEPEHKLHLSALESLRLLEPKRQQRDTLKNQMSQTEAAIIRAQTEKKGCGDNLQKALNAREQIEKLKPLAEDQSGLELRREALRGDLADARAADKQISGYETKLKNLRTRLADINAKVKETEAAAAFEKPEVLQKKESELAEQIGRLRAAAEHEEKFRTEILESLIKNKFCPIFSQSCLNLETGRASDEIIRQENQVSLSQITVLEGERRTLSGQLALARDAEKKAAALPTLVQLRAEVTEEGTRLRDEQNTWKTRAEGFSKSQGELEVLEMRLRELDNPKGKLKLFEKEAAGEDQIRKSLAESEAALARIENEKTVLTQSLAEYNDLETDWNRRSSERDRTAQAHRDFLTNEAQARMLPERESAVKTAAENTSKLGAVLKTATAEFEKAGQKYDRERHDAERLALADAERRATQIGAMLGGVRQREKQLGAELEKLRAVRESMQNEFAEKDKLQKVTEATEFVRATLKEAAPRVARNLVFHISLEANQMYREITGNAERTLKWTEDYGIVLEENGYDRPFVNLSGGEQMAAALSVRLAILRQLSDVRLAFFDEPTTNMDAERRENLATQISQIKHFEQLFVISHDDTFEGYVDNIVTVGGDPGVGADREE